MSVSIDDLVSPRRRLSDNVPTDWAFLPTYTSTDVKNGRKKTVSTELPEDLADVLMSLAGRTDVPFDKLQHMLREGGLILARILTDQLENVDPRLKQYVLAEMVARDQRIDQITADQLYQTVSILEDNLYNDLCRGVVFSVICDHLFMRRREVQEMAEPWRTLYTEAIDSLAIVQMLDEWQGRELDAYDRDQGTN
jgi:hypothetical protein